jgi:hypothetical protein
MSLRSSALLSSAGRCSRCITNNPTSVGLINTLYCAVMPPGLSFAITSSFLYRFDGAGTRCLRLRAFRHRGRVNCTLCWIKHVHAEPPHSSGVCVFGFLGDKAFALIDRCERLAAKHTLNQGYTAANENDGANGRPITQLRHEKILYPVQVGFAGRHDDIRDIDVFAKQFVFLCAACLFEVGSGGLSFRPNSDLICSAT